MQRVMGTFAPTRRGTRLRIAASKEGERRQPVTQLRRRLLDRIGLEREDLFAIPLCVLWASGMMRLAAQAFAVMQSVQPAAMALTVSAGQSPWLTALRLPVLMVRKYFGW